MTYFSVQGESSLLNLPKGSTVMFLGVGGIAMSQLAIFTKNQGYQVIGFDQNIYEPSRSALAKAQISIIQNAADIPWNIDFYVIGNSVTRNHPVLPLIENRNSPYCCMPKLVSDFTRQSKERVVIAGTHGKSTTTALTAFMLRKMGINTSLLVGAMSKSGIPLTDFCGSSVAVLEGDEYDSAFYAKFSKFRYYDPTIFLVGPLDYDHKDIFKTEQDYFNNFIDYIGQLRGETKVLINRESFQKLSSWDYNNRLAELSQRVTQLQTNDIFVKKLTPNLATVNIKDKQWQVNHNLIGSHNLQNLLSACMVCFLISGTVPDDITDFWGLKRRLEVVKETEDIILIDDFAHHPSEVKAGIEAVRETYTDRTVCVIFEPRSNTSRSSIFQSDYAMALSGADMVFLRHPVIRHNDNPDEMFDPEIVLEKSGKRGGVINEVSDSTVEQIISQIKRIPRRKVIIVMSNGSFDGIVETISRLL